MRTPSTTVLLSTKTVATLLTAAAAAAAAVAAEAALVRLEFQLLQFVRK
jgi:hypothetical protein